MSQLDVVSQKKEGLDASATDKTPNHALRTLLILSLLMAFASISTDLYLPAMPEMAQALNISPGTLQFTVTGYLIGFAAGQLFWGPISDRFGRKLPVAIGLILFIIGSAGCAMATDGTQIIIWRVVKHWGHAQTSC